MTGGPGEAGARILLVEDDATVADVVVAYLGRAGYAVEHAPDGPAGLAAARRATPDLVVLDLMLPGLDGHEVFAALRAQQSGLPVIMLTARGDEGDRIAGLAMGADDYVTKPFSPRELVLRVASVLRRARPDQGRPTDDEVRSDGDLLVDAGRRVATRGGAVLELTTREFDLLRFLLANPGRAFTREELLRTVWGWEFGDQSTVTVHVRRLRTKIEQDPARPCRLVTVWGVGYRWDPS